MKPFQAVKKPVHPKRKQTENKDGIRLHEVFTEHHVGILITPIMFAAPFTVPGGNDPKTGIPSLSHNRIFDVYAIADAVSLFSSTSSVLNFSGILTSRYAENDFRYSLPWKLMVALFTLFSSVVAMIVASCAVVGMMPKGYPQSRVRTILGLASIPVLVLVPLQLRRLFFQFFDSTACPLLKQLGSYLLVRFSKCFGFMLRKKISSWTRTPDLDV